MIEHRYITSNGLRFHVATAGPSDGPLIVLLHGFPEHWYSWRHQIEPLAQAGFCVWAPDQRGYNLTDKPAGIKPYALHHLTADVADLSVPLAAREPSSSVTTGAVSSLGTSPPQNLPPSNERSSSMLRSRPS